MKKIIVGSLLGLLCVSCSRDKDDTVAENNSIVGTWVYVKASVNGVSENYTNECASMPDYVTFNSNGTGVEVNYDAQCKEVDRINITYRVDGNKLYSSEWDGYVIIKELSSKTLIIEDTHNDYDGDGKNDTYLVELKRK